MKIQASLANRMSHRLHSLAWGRWAGIFFCICGGVLIGGYMVLNRFVTPTALEERLNGMLSDAANPYRLDIGSVRFNTLNRSLLAEGILLHPEERELEKAPSGARYYISVGQLRVTALNLVKLILFGVVEAGGLQVDGLSLDIRSGRGETLVDDSDPSARAVRDSLAADSAAASHRALHRLLTDALPGFRLDSLKINRGEFSFVNEQGQTHRIEGLTLLLRNLHVNNKNRDAQRFLFSEDVRLSLPAQQFTFADGLYALQVGGLEGSSLDSVLQLKTLTYEPTVTDEEFVQRRTYRKDRYKLRVDSLLVGGLSYWQLFEERAWQADWMAICSGVLDVYKSKLLPPGPGRRPLFPHEAMQQLPFPVSIDSILVRSGHIRYSEIAEDGLYPGTITFEEIEGRIRHVSNDSTKSEIENTAIVEARTQLAGAGLLETTIELPLSTTAFDMHYQGRLGRMDAMAFNGIFTNLAGLHIEKGEIDSLAFDIGVRSGVTDGALRMYYHDLKVKMVDKKDKSRSLLDRVKSMILDGPILNSRNPPDEGPLRIGEVTYQREEEDGFFRFLWRPILNGMRTSAGM